MSSDKRTIEIKAKHKGMFLSPWVNNDPTIPDNATYWLVDETTDLPVIVDPVSLELIDEMLNTLPDKDLSEARPDPLYGDGTGGQSLSILLVLIAGVRLAHAVFQCLLRVNCGCSLCELESLLRANNRRPVSFVVATTAPPLIST